MLDTARSLLVTELSVACESDTESVEKELEGIFSDQAEAELEKTA